MYAHRPITAHGDPPLVRVWDWLMPIVLFCWGMWSYPIAMLGPERNLVPGYMGDARFNNYVLEHFHAYATGRVDHYWDAPMMYPQPNVIAHSENLLGTAPIYSAFRKAGLPRETAFQLWLLALFTLNYWCAYIVLLRWTRRSWLAACGAFFFAFGVYGVAQMSNAEVLPRFLMPVVLYLFWRWLSTARPRYLLLATVATVAQFYCGIQLGLLVLYATGCLLLGHALVYRKSGAWLQWHGRASWLPVVGAVLVGIALLSPLLLPYMRVAELTGSRAYVEVANSIPRLRSLFFAHPAALSWQDLTTHGEHSLPAWWRHHLFVGAVPWLAVLFVPVLIRRGRPGPEDLRPLAAFGLAWSIAVVCCLNVGGFSIWRVFHVLPGFGALGSMDRMLHVHAMFFLFVLVSVVHTIARGRRAATALAVLLPLLLVIDNRIDVARMVRHDKHRSHRDVDQVARQMQEQFARKATAMAWCPVRPPMVQDEVRRSTIATQTTAMLAAQQCGIPLVNAYTHSFSHGFMPFFDHMDRPTLNAWLDLSGTDHDAVQVLDNLGLPWSSQQKVALAEMAGKYVELRDPWSGVLSLGADTASLAACFTMIALEDGRRVLLASNGRFVAADLSEGDRALRADAPVAGDFCLFIMEDVMEDGFVLRADNGRWIGATEGGMLHAWTDSMHHATIFRTWPLPDGVR